MRRVNRIASGVLGVLLIAAGLLVAVEMVLIAAGRQPAWLPLQRWYQTIGFATLGSRGVLITAILAGLVGLGILVAQLRRWKPDRVLAGSGSGAPWWVSRRSVQRRTAIAAGALAGIGNARADVRGRPQSWRLRLRADGGPDQRDAVQRAVRDELDRLNVSAATAVDVVLRKPNRRVA
jgi:hypothetical protein